MKFQVKCRSFPYLVSLIISSIVVLPINLLPVVQASPNLATLRPNGAGDSTQWSVIGAASNWNACWSDDGDTSYVYTGTSNYLDLYNIDAMYGSPTYVTVYVRARATPGGGAPQFRITIKTHNFEYLSDYKNTASSYTLYSYSWDNNPNTTAEWTQEEVNNLQVGMKSIFFFGNQIRVTEVYVEVTYTTPDTTPPEVITFCVSQTYAGEPAAFTAEFKDNIGLSYCIFGWRNGSGASWSNETISFSSWVASNYWGYVHITKTLNYTVGAPIQYRFWANDTSNNWASTPLETFSTTAEPAWTTVKLYVDSNTSDYTAWNANGSQPYLNAQDQPINYIYTTEYGISMGDFLFADIGAIEIRNVKLRFYYYVSSPSAYINVSFYNGSWVFLGSFNGAWQWKNISVTEKSNQRSVNDMKIRFTAHLVSGAIKAVDCAYLEVEAINSTVAYPFNSSNLYVGSFDNSVNEWTVDGSSPYLDVQDQPTNYIYTSLADKTIGNFTFKNLSAATVAKNITLRIYYKVDSVSDKIRVYLLNKSVTRDQFSDKWTNRTWVNIYNLTKSAWTWTSIDVSSINWWWTVGDLTQLKMKFVSFGSGGVKAVDCVYLVVRHMDIEKNMEWLFKTAEYRNINPTFPYSRDYDEYNKKFWQLASPQILTGFLFSTMTQNETMKTYYNSKTYEVINWVNKTNILNLFSLWDTTTNEWRPALDYGAGNVLMQVAALAHSNATYENFLKRAINKWQELFLPLNTCRPYEQIYRNGTVITPSTSSDNLYVNAPAVAYTGMVLNNDTIKNWSNSMILNYKLSGINLPYQSTLQDGSGSGTYCKEDEVYGFYLLAAESVYYCTGNTTIKDKIKTVASESWRFWMANYRCFHYWVHAEVGIQPAYWQSVHGHGMIDEALISAHLIWSNTTWLERARSDIDELAVKGYILYNDLVSHAVNFDVSNPDQHHKIANYESQDDWNAHTRRASLILYNLDSINHNSTYISTFNKLYWSTSIIHMQSLGWAASIQQLQLIPTTVGGDPSADVGFFALYRNFNNKTDITISTFDDIITYFGFPNIGVSSVFNLNFRTKDWDLTDNIQNADVYLDGNIKVSDSGGWTKFTGSGKRNVKVSYLGHWVNGSFSVMMDNVNNNKTIDVQCKIYDAYFHIVDNIGSPVLGANVTAYTTTALEHQIGSGKTNSSGYAYIANLPNSTSLPIAVYYPDNQTLRANTTRNISSDEVITSNIMIIRFSLVTLYKVHLDLIEDFYEGSNLVAAFYDYQNRQEANATVLSITPPEYVTLFIDITHPIYKGIENITLVLTDDFGNSIRTVTGYIVRRSDLMKRTSEIDVQWTYASIEERKALFRELVETDGQWSCAPS